MGEQAPAASWWQSGGNALSSLTSRISDALSHSADVQSSRSTGNAAIVQDDGSIWLLGRRYTRTAADQQPLQPLQPSQSSQPQQPLGAMEFARSEQFAADFRSRLWMTYRFQFPMIAHSLFTTDAGWGCMLRCGQSMLAQALVLHHLGRDWRMGERGVNDELWRRYVQIVGWFLDEGDVAAGCRFSIHHMVRAGAECCDIGVGQWYAPMTVSRVVHRLLGHAPAADGTPPLHCHIVTDGTLYREQVEQIMGVWPQGTGLMLLMPLRLGVDTINPIYFDPLRRCLQLDNSLGIAGGKPNSALYFVGLSGLHKLIYLDPHIARAAVKVRAGTPPSQQELMTYHCDTVRLINFVDLDPSLLLGFYCADAAAFDGLCSQLQSMSPPLVAVQQTCPDYDDELDIESDCASSNASS